MLSDPGRTLRRREPKAEAAPLRVMPVIPVQNTVCGTHVWGSGKVPRQESVGAAMVSATSRALPARSGFCSATPTLQSSPLIYLVFSKKLTGENKLSLALKYRGPRRF